MNEETVFVVPQRIFPIVLLRLNKDRKLLETTRTLKLYSFAHLFHDRQTQFVVLEGDSTLKTVASRSYWNVFRFERQIEVHSESG